MIYFKDNNDKDFFANGNFSVNKGCLPFSPIGGDHAIGHENRSFMVFEGIYGYVNRKIALEQYFITGPEMHNIMEDLCIAFDIT